MTQIRLNATSISDMKACPQRFRLRHVERIAPVEDADTLRMGSNWHKCQEVYSKAINERPFVDRHRDDVKQWAIDLVVGHLNSTYEKIPNTKTPLEWAVEKAILLTSFCVYQAYYAEQPLEVVATEQKFEIPLINPRVGMLVNPKLAVVTGRMDKIVKFNNNICVLEYKSTSQDIAPDAEYWQLLRKNEQVSIYAMALRNLAAQNTLQLGNTLYDVFRKPQIEPKMLSEADWKKLETTGEYYSQKFVVDVGYGNTNAGPMTERIITVNGEVPEVKQLAKGITIRETVGMFSARLQETMAADPARYFQRREIARTEQELKEFEKELYAVYMAMRIFDDHNCYYSSPHSCKNPIRCPFIPICFGPGADSVTPDSEPPAGFKRIPLHVVKPGV